MTDPKLFIGSMVRILEDAGYTECRGEANFYHGGWSNDSIVIRWTDLLGESHSHYESRKNAEVMEVVYDRMRVAVGLVKPANEALRGDAAAMVAKLKEKLAKAGFEKEVWMEELSGIVKTLSSNALVHVPDSFDFDNVTNRVD